MKKVGGISNLIVMLMIFLSLGQSIIYSQVKGGRWMFENNPNDEASWDVVENNGALSGNAIFSNTGISIQGDYYLSLEDSSNYGVFTVPDQEELDFLDENFAASLWVYPVKGYDNPQHLLMKGDRSGSVKNNNYAIRINNDRFEFIVHSESGQNKFAKSSFKVVENEWNFIAVYYDYTASKLYLWNDYNSTPIDTMDFNAPLFPNNDKLYIGTSGENGFKRFWGRIDDVRIGNKVEDIFDITSGIEINKKGNSPSMFTLSQNYPNPFNPETEIKFSLIEKGNVKLIVYDILGNQIERLVDGELSEGEYKVGFNARNLSSGVYLYMLRQGNRTLSKKMILTK